MTRRSFSGITTVEDLMGRCVVDEFTGCWHWRGASSLDRNGVKLQRLWVFDTQRGGFRVMSGPYAVLELSGKRKPSMTMGWRTCTSDDCMNPAHVQGGTRADWGHWLSERGAWRGLPSKVAANRRANRARSVLTAQKVAEIRASDLPRKELAAAHGISYSHLCAVKSGKKWADAVVPGASVFTLGMVR